MPSSERVNNLLIRAAKYGTESLEIIQELCEDLGADVNCVQAYESPLLVATACGHLEVVALLLDYGADVNRLYIFKTYSEALMFWDTCLVICLENVPEH